MLSHYLVMTTEFVELKYCFLVPNKGIQTRISFLQAFQRKGEHIVSGGPNKNGRSVVSSEKISGGCLSGI